VLDALLGACNTTAGAGAGIDGGGQGDREERRPEQGVRDMDQDRIEGAAKQANGAIKEADRRFAGATMPLSRQHLPVNQAVRENGAQPRLRAAAFDLRKPVARRAAALEALFRTDWQRAAPRSRGNLALTAESYLRARIVVEHVLAPELAAPLTLLAARYA
jgi:hypothetical protein